MAVRTAKEIALETCSAEVQSKISEVAALSDVPDDDPLWLVFLATAKARTETKLMGALLDKIGALEEGMSLLTEALLENDAALKDLRLQIEQSNQESQTRDQQAEQVRFANLRRWLIVSVIAVVGLATVAAIEAVVITMRQPSSAWETTRTAPPPSRPSQQLQHPLQQQGEPVFVETESILLRELGRSLSPASQERLEDCLNQNAKCALLIDEPLDDEGFDAFVEEDPKENTEYEEH